MKKLKTLILTRKDVECCIDMTKAIRAVEEAFGQYALGRARMPSKIYLDVKEFNGDFRAMPAYIAKSCRSSLKWVNAHPQNARSGLPAVMAVIILNDAKTGFPLSIMDGTYATSIRTGAGAAVAAKYLARKDSSVVGLVGCGVQARTQLLALRKIFKIKEVRVRGYDISSAKNFMSQMKIVREQMAMAKSIEACVRGCDIVVTTTPSRAPIVKAKWISPGTHFNAIGADARGKQELDPQILRTAKVVVDDWAQASHSGEINVPLEQGVISRKDIYAELGEIVCGQKPGRANAKEITVFDSTGLAIQDTAIADVIFRAAIRQKIGRYVNFVGI